MFRKHEIDMLNGPLAGKILLFSLPLMASTILQLLFNAADIVVVGRYVGKQALAAVGSNTSLLNLFISLFVGLSVGANVTIAQDLGAGHTERANRGVHTALSLALLSGLFLALVGSGAAPRILVWMRSPEDVIDLASLYLRIYFLGMPANMTYNFGSAILRAKGDTERPLFFLTVAGAANVGMNLFFVLVLHLSVAGVALATILSQYISAFLILRCLMGEEGELKLELRRLCLDRVIVRRIVRVGLPAGFQGVVFSLANVTIQSTVNSFGSTLSSGSAAAQNVESFVYAAMNSFYQAALTFSGQNYGAGQCSRVNRVTLLCVSYAASCGLLLGNLAYWAGSSLLRLYIQSGPEQAAIISAGLLRMGKICRFYALCGVMDTMVGALRGIGYSTVPMIVSLLGSCVLRLLWVYFIFPLDPTPQTLFLSYPITWAITGAVHIITFLTVRPRAYAKVSGLHPPYLAVDGQHPQVEAPQPREEAAQP